MRDVSTPDPLSFVTITRNSAENIITIDPNGVPDGVYTLILESYDDSDGNGEDNEEIALFSDTITVTITSTSISTPITPAVAPVTETTI